MHHHRLTSAGVLGGVALSLAVALALVAGLASSPAPARAQDTGWVPVTILYTSDVKGHIDPCG